jgi:Fe-S cluster biosynthesis and repair protein YggX
MSDNTITVNIIGDKKKFPDENGNRIYVQISSKNIKKFQVYLHA